MNEILTPELVLAMGQEWKRLLIQQTSKAELKAWMPAELKQELIDQGIEQGIEQGVNQKTHDIVLGMHAKGFDLAVIADVTGLSVAQVQTLLSTKGTKATGA